MGKTYTDYLIKQSKKPKVKKQPVPKYKKVIVKVKKRLNQPLIKGGRGTSLGGGKVRVSSKSFIRGILK